ncbi:hypothetical protein RHGRI_032017 [Rhododendron griersonianum]|uniref:Transmembrane protein n=1 Tax=Rhododendron griersonianum TaxID=479676 RepID=A0AAV6IAM9_9ERIC|nr:hypothetical protein RHGRI_032017 [Rhododendron griersonianum]
MPDLLCGQTTSPPPPLIRSLASKKPTRIWRLQITNPPTAGFANDRGLLVMGCLLVVGDGGGWFFGCGDARQRRTRRRGGYRGWGWGWGWGWGRDVGCKGWDGEDDVFFLDRRKDEVYLYSHAQYSLYIYIYIYIYSGRSIAFGIVIAFYSLRPLISVYFVKLVDKSW